MSVYYRINGILNCGEVMNDNVNMVIDYGVLCLFVVFQMKMPKLLKDQIFGLWVWRI